MEVIGERELGFFKGVCRGSVYKGFEYGSERGTRAARLRVDRGKFNDARVRSIPESVHVYGNGGGVFVGAEEMHGVEVLAKYDEKIDVHAGGENAAAVVYISVGQGGVVLTGPHPEYDIPSFIALPVTDHLLTK